MSPEMRQCESITQSPASSLPARVGVELSDDPAFARRIIRLGSTSVVALGLIYLVARFTSVASATMQASLALGWLLMPTILFASLRLPTLRYALVIPSTLVAVPLLTITTLAFQGSATAALGWLLLTAGILLGGFLGMWFWFRWIPVPAPLHDPFSRGRWMFIRIHVLLIVSGFILVVASTV